MSEVAPCDVMAPFVEPLDAVWQARALAVPLRRRGTDVDPLTPFIHWIMTRHLLGEDQALQLAQGVLRLLEVFPIAEVLTEDPRALVDRIPCVQARMYVGGKLSAHAKKPRRCMRLFQEWAAVRGSI
jgi:hypothetical protein